ncbi:MAG: hypothetical protein KY455_07310 [Euryarchaeota archaeon]|nr:hypothetical protein [Euryarchaeota archaeon]
MRGHRSLFNALLATVLVLSLLSAPAWAGPGHHHAGDDHPDPGKTASFTLFPGHEEVVDSVMAHEDHPWVTLELLGMSGEGRPIYLAIVADPDSPVPMEERVRTFIFTQQHGNEPAGTPAALTLLDDIAKGGSIAETLENQVLILLPMVNPDGAEKEQRRNSQDRDINRDHIGLETPEANLLHDVLNRFDPHVAMDHHEYGGVGFGHPVPVRLYDYDLTTLFPVHGNVRIPTRAAAEDLMYKGIWPKAEEAGYTANEYGEQTVAGVPVEQIAGGPDPGIMRNHLGLHNVAGLLVETFVNAQDNPFHDAARRIAIHEVVMRATLEYVHDNAGRFKAAKAESGDLNVLEPMDRYIEGDKDVPLAAAYKVPMNDTFAALFAAHGLSAGIPVMDGMVHNMDDPHQGHVAAILHPESARMVVAGEATERVEPPVVEAQAQKVSESPVVPVVTLLGLALLLLRRRS